MPKKGFMNYLYINTSEDETPVWTEIDLAKDVNVNKEKAELNANCRKYAREGFAVVEDGLKTVGYEFDSLVPAVGEAANAGFAALDAAYDNNTAVEVIRADGPKSTENITGERVMCGVFGGTRSEPLEDLATVSFTLKAKGVPKKGKFGAGGVWADDA